MPAPSDLVHQTTSSTGTGALTLTAENGKRSFLTAFGTGGTNTFDYFISNRGAAEWERGTGHENAGTLVRDTVIASSNANAAVNFSAGTKDVTNDIPAGNQARLDAAQVWTAAQTFINSSGVKIRDTNASHTLGLIVGSDLTADRTLTVTPGDASRILTISGDTTLGGGSHSGTNTGDQTVPAAAAQSDQETATSTTTYVSPGRQQYHPSAAKVWCAWGVTTTIDASYNVSSITDNGTGDWTLNFTTAFSSANYSVVLTYQHSSLTYNAAFSSAVRNGGPATGSVRTVHFSNLGITDPTKNYATCFGDQ